MKRGIILIALTVLCITASCKKNHVCSCKTIVSDGSTSAELPKEDYVLNEMKTKVAVDSCNAKDSFYTTGGVSTTKNCELN